MAEQNKLLEKKAAADAIARFQPTQPFYYDSDDSSDDEAEQKLPEQPAYVTSFAAECALRAENIFADGIGDRGELEKHFAIYYGSERAKKFVANYYAELEATPWKKEAVWPERFLHLTQAILDEYQPTDKSLITMQNLIEQLNARGLRFHTTPGVAECIIAEVEKLRGEAKMAAGARNFAESWDIFRLIALEDQKPQVITDETAKKILATTRQAFVQFKYDLSTDKISKSFGAELIRRIANNHKVPFHTAMEAIWFTYVLTEFGKPAKDGIQKFEAGLIQAVNLAFNYLQQKLNSEHNAEVFEQAPIFYNLGKAMNNLAIALEEENLKESYQIEQAFNIPIIPGRTVSAPAATTPVATAAASTLSTPTESVSVATTVTTSVTTATASSAVVSTTPFSAPVQPGVPFRLVDPENENGESEDAPLVEIPLNDDKTGALKMK